MLCGMAAPPAAPVQRASCNSLQSAASNSGPLRIRRYVA